jgi:hypothetical protein
VGATYSRFRLLQSFPRLAITSPEKGCGKTTALDVLRELVARPLSTSNVTASAVFRTVEIARPTLLIDEADTFLTENEALRGTLNSGHCKGAAIIRTVGDDHEPRQFSTWSPAAIAMIGNLPSTLDDRAVAVRLRRRKPTERVQAFRSDRTANLQNLARKAADPDMGPLINRVADNWRPLFAIADIAGGKWPKHARTVAHGAEAKKEDQSVGTMLLSDIREIFTTRPESDRISSTELASTLGLMEGRLWAEWRNGKPMTAAAMARMLSPFGIFSRTRRAGTDTFKGYLYSDFEEAFSSYLANSANQTVTPSQRNNDGHCDVLQTVTLDEDVTLSKVSQRNNDGHCDGVTVWKRGIEEKEEVSPARRCAQCNQLGELLECHYGNAAAWLHRNCQDAWKADCDRREASLSRGELLKDESIGLQGSNGEPTIELDEEPAIVVAEPDSAAHLAAQHNELTSERHIFSFKPTLRLEWRGQDGQDKP